MMYIGVPTTDVLSDGVYAPARMNGNAIGHRLERSKQPVQSGGRTRDHCHTPYSRIASPTATTRPLLVVSVPETSISRPLVHGTRTSLRCSESSVLRMPVAGRVKVVSSSSGPGTVVLSSTSADVVLGRSSGTMLIAVLVSGAGMRSKAVGASWHAASARRSEIAAAGGCETSARLGEAESPEHRGHVCSGCLCCPAVIRILRRIRRVTAGGFGRRVNISRASPPGKGYVHASRCAPHPCRSAAHDPRPGRRSRPPHTSNRSPGRATT